MDLSEIHKRLRELGWADESQDDPDWDLEVRRYQQWHGLTVDGEPGRVTQRVMSGDEQPMFCALPDRLGLGEDDCRWPEPRNVWVTLGEVPDRWRLMFADAVALAARWWREVCGWHILFAERHDNPQIVIATGRIDGPSGTLAWSELPCGLRTNNDKRIRQKYDEGEPFVLSETPPRGKLDLARIVCHELGHAGGIGHNPGRGTLMSPTYDDRVRKPVGWDVREAQSRYGPPFADEPDEPPQPGLTDVWEIDVTGNVKLTKNGRPVRIVEI